MPTAQEYATFSAHVYGGSDAPPIPTGWESLPVPANLSNNSATGFSGEAYRNPGTGKIVIAYRGFEPTDRGDHQFVREIVPPKWGGLGKVPSQFEDATKLYDWVKLNYAPPNDKISFTGHSEGGALAQLMTYTKGIYSETFGAPGVAHLLSQLTPNPDGGLDNALNHVFTTDAVGMTGKHVGSVVYDLHLPDVLEVATCLRMGPYVCLGLYLYNSHRIQTYRDLFTTAAGAGQAPIWQSSPLVLDLNGDGVQTTALTSGAFFDLDANGFAEQTGWVDPHDGLLVRDLNGNGTIDDGGELFGDHTVLTTGTTAPNGFEALNDLDENGDGKLDAADAAWTQLKIWRDGDGDGRSAGDELHALGEFQITALDLTYHHSSDRDAAGNDHWHQGQFTMGGVTRAMDDVWFKTDPTLTLATQWLDVPAEIAALPDAQGFGNVYDLHQAMVRDTSGALEGLVQYFVSQTDPIARTATLDSLLFTWTGSAGLDPASRGGFIDARQLAVLEQVYQSC